MKYYIDRCTRDEVVGWAFGDTGAARIDTFIDDYKVDLRTTKLVRHDVGDAYPQMPHSATSGFRIHLPDTPLSKTKLMSSLRLVISADGRDDSVEFQLPSTATVEASRLAFWQAHRSPFPPVVMAAIEGISDIKWRELKEWTADDIAHAIEILLFLLKAGSRKTPNLFSYFSLLSRLARSFEFIGANFPVATASDGKDETGAASSPQEHFVIAHHLMTLRSQGVMGDLLEFGCFKGFSTSCLSFACKIIGAKMHVFDSFAGLPPSKSKYYSAGDFAGSFDEVLRNVSNFGAPEAITFHRGFFSETVTTAALEDIACIWMDVDLESSAQDMLVLLPRLDPKGCVFTHESAPEHFNADGVIVAKRHPDTVLPPIRDAFAADKRRPRGRYLVGATGVVWDQRKSVPVPVPEMLKLYDAVLKA